MPSSRSRRNQGGPPLPDAPHKYKLFHRAISTWREAEEGREDGAPQRPSRRLFQQVSRCVLDSDTCPAGHHHFKTRKYASCPRKSRRLPLRGTLGRVSPSARAFSPFVQGSCGAHGCDPPPPFKARCSGRCVLGTGLKIGGLPRWLQAFCSRKELRVLSLRWLVSNLAQMEPVSGGWCLAAPIRLQVGFFSLHARVGVPHLVFSSSSDKTVP